MTRKVFLTALSIVALAVGAIAFFAPAILLESKGAVPSPVAFVWVSEVGVLLVSLGVMAFLVRDHDDSPTLRAFLIGNLVLHLGLLPIEVIAYSGGIITKLSGIMPNTVFHVLVIVGLTYYLAKMKKTGVARSAL